MGAADALLRDEAFAASVAPEVVLSLGDAWSSRVVATWLAAQHDTLHILVDPHGRWIDADRTAGWVLGCDPSALCRAIAARPELGESPREPAWLAAWVGAESTAQRVIDDVLADHAETTEPAVARELVRELPDGATLVVASSMPVRDVEWYGPARTGLRVLVNRGANGIDGVVSTAVGAAVGCGAPWPAGPALAPVGAGGPVVALLGDLALLHDAGGLLSARWTGASLTLVVVDNAGGGIFSFLPQAEELERAEFERLFGTPPGIDPVEILAGYGVRARVVDRARDFAPAVLEAAGRPGIAAVVVRTDRAANVAVHDEIHAAIAAALASTR